MTFIPDYQKLIENSGRATIQDPGPSKLETIGASFAREIENTPLNSFLGTLESQNEKNRSETFLEPEEINQKYPRLKGRFTERQGDKFLELANAREQRRAILDKVIADGGGNEDLSLSNIGFKTSKFAADMALHVVDPFNAMAAALIPESALLAVAPKITKLGAQIVTNIAADVAVQGTLVASAKVQEGLDLKIDEMLFNSAVGGTLFPIGAKVLSATFKPLVDKFGSVFNRAIKQTVVDQLERGELVDVSPVIDSAIEMSKKDINKEIKFLNSKAVKSEEDNLRISELQESLIQHDQAAPNLDKKEVRKKRNSKKARQHYDNEAEEEVNRRMKSTTKDIVPDHKEVMDELMGELKQAEELGLLDAEDIKVLREIENDLGTSEKTEEALKALTFCIRNLV